MDKIIRKFYFLLMVLSAINYNLVLAEDRVSVNADLSRAVQKQETIVIREASKLQSLEEFCNSFAKSSVEQNAWQEKQSCGYKSAEWLGSYSDIYNRCMSSDQKEVLNEEKNKKTQAIAQCICGPYALSAVSQNADQTAAGCNLQGNEWSYDYNSHFRWCETGGGGIIENSSFKTIEDSRLQKIKTCNRIRAIGRRGNIKLNSSPYYSNPKLSQLDLDNDGLIDYLENELADQFRPYLIFDSDETSRQPNEPIALFQVSPVEKPKLGAVGIAKFIQIEWALLYSSDSYGPDSGTECTWTKEGKHKGDVENITYLLYSGDQGITWSFVEIQLAGWKPGPKAEFTNGLPDVSYKPAFHDYTHPTVYVSASKHHMYFDTKNNHEDSLYGNFWGCNDDVNGKGKEILVNIHAFDNYYGFNNVGESCSHSDMYFVNDLAKYYSDKCAWCENNFYESSVVRNIWLK